MAIHALFPDAMRIILTLPTIILISVFFVSYGTPGCCWNLIYVPSSVALLNYRPSVAVFGEINLWFTGVELRVSSANWETVTMRRADRTWLLWIRPTLILLFRRKNFWLKMNGVCLSMTDCLNYPRLGLKRVQQQVIIPGTAERVTAKLVLIWVWPSSRDQEIDWYQSYVIGWCWSSSHLEYEWPISVLQRGEVDRLPIQDLNANNGVCVQRLRNEKRQRLMWCVVRLTDPSVIASEQVRKQINCSGIRDNNESW